LIRKWVADDAVCGIRVDHPDGLRDPTQYFLRLRALTGDTWIVAEKILAHDEELPDEWPIDGTSGYDFLNIAGGLFINSAGEAQLTDTYRKFTAETDDFESIAMAGKLKVLQDNLGGDLNRLAAIFYQICSNDRHYRDFTRRDVEDVLRTTLGCMNVYRTYLRLNSKYDSRSTARISAAIEKAKTARNDLDARLFDLLESILSMQRGEPLAGELALRFQQTSAAVMAKGLEDTAFYRFNRFIALNEVGGDPAQFGYSLDHFHAWCIRTAKRWPRTMLATSTHDTKRSEDVRTRLSVLSEIPDRWEATVMRWSASNDIHWSGEPPDRNMEYHLYQTLLGAWPIDEMRLQTYSKKAAREAKTQTSWNQPNEKYETALEQFIHAVMHDEAFLEDLSDFVRDVIERGRINSLALVLLKLTAPGIPDLYQGTELWSLNLVDPDNRQPVDYELRRLLLADLRNATPEEVMRRSDEGLPKLWLIMQGLALRNSHPEWFDSESSYNPLNVSGKRLSNVIAFARGKSVISIAPRLMFGKDWGDTNVELPEGRWNNSLTGEQMCGGTTSVMQLLERFPVALLVREEAL
jgi:(1->4)-alpha-D-glucan 1-alpha-D-glucosylmutase